MTALRTRSISSDAFAGTDGNSEMSHVIIRGEAEVTVSLSGQIAALGMHYVEPGIAVEFRIDGFGAVYVEIT